MYNHQQLKHEVEQIQESLSLSISAMDNAPDEASKEEAFELVLYFNTRVMELSKTKAVEVVTRDWLSKAVAEGSEIAKRYQDSMNSITTPEQIAIMRENKESGQALVWGKK